MDGVKSAYCLMNTTTKKINKWYPTEYLLPYNSETTVYLLHNYFLKCLPAPWTISYARKHMHDCNSSR